MNRKVSDGSRGVAKGDDQGPRALFLSGRQGDQRAYQSFLIWCAGFVRSILQSINFKWGDGLANELDDILQEVLMAVHSKRHTFSEDLPVEPWVATIARFKAIDHLRAKKRAVDQLVNDELWKSAVDRVSLTMAEEIFARGDIEVILGQLSDDQRELIRLTKIEGFSTKETALRLGISESAVKVGVHRIIKKLQTFVERQ